jgi:sugar/nucleoside kinase (ribokinase family)
MQPPPFDVLAIGNAIVDVVGDATDAFLVENQLEKGIMTLIDAARAEQLYGRMGPGREISGGSAANTAAGIASLGGQAAFIGKVRNDQLGQIFRHDIRAAGVAFESKAAEDGPPTARCFVFVTPDALRTMQTFLGACVELGPEDVEERRVASARITYLEGYLWDKPRAKQAFLKAAKAARTAGRRTALTLSDPFCVERHRESFLELLAHIDILFANENELIALMQAPDFDAGLQQIRGRVPIAALTRGAKGSIAIAGNEIHVIDPVPPTRLVDTTGAGDLYAAGFLFGLTREVGLAAAGRIASIAAAEAISHYGARPEAALSQLVRPHLR